MISHGLPYRTVLQSLQSVKEREIVVKFEHLAAVFDGFSECEARC